MARFSTIKTSTFFTVAIQVVKMANIFWVFWSWNLILCFFNFQNCQRRPQKLNKIALINYIFIYQRLLSIFFRVYKWTSWAVWVYGKNTRWYWRILINFLLSFYVTTEFELQQLKRRRGVPYECIIKQLKHLWIFYCISIIAVNFFLPPRKQTNKVHCEMPAHAPSLSLFLSCN